ncbi:hypothetical protein KYK29_16295 [Shinella daejeonensis]|uniref:hypothetical protein n=1 Tax=Shinella daejeonensis TaxID=659017 RepID=UPI0020C81F3B|nr:hypothetical protein [Shinella daejeonensis]MCP8896487.1 hypothetical protein [Shinella daejeonensis]
MIYRAALSIIVALALEGCCNCDMLGGSQPAHCNAGLAAGAVLAATASDGFVANSKL